MRQVPQSFTPHTFLKVRGHITRRVFVYYVTTAAVVFAAGLVLTRELADSDAVRSVLFFALAFYPASGILFVAYFKRLRNAGLKLPMPVALLVIAVVFVPPVFVTIVPFYVFHAVVSVVMFLLDSHGSEHKKTLYGYVYAMVASPDVLEINTQTGDQYIVRSRHSTAYTDAAGTDTSFDGISKHDLVEVHGYDVDGKTVWADTVSVVESASEGDVSFSGGVSSPAEENGAAVRAEAGISN